LTDHWKAIRSAFNKVVLGKDVHTLGSSGPQKNIQRHTLGMKGVHAPSHYRSDDVAQAHCRNNACYMKLNSVTYWSFGRKGV